MFTLRILLPPYSQLTGLSVEIDSSTYPLAENGTTGVFEATITEDLVGIHSYTVLRNNISAAVGDFTRYPGSTVVVADIEDPLAKNRVLILTQGDSYDGISNPKLMFPAKGMTSGAVHLTIRNIYDEILVTQAGTIEGTLAIIPLQMPDNLVFTCGTKLRGKYDVEVVQVVTATPNVITTTKTIALGDCVIYQDQTRENP